MDVEVMVAALVGAIFGFAADRLSARWPDHEGGAVRRLDWRTMVVALVGAAGFAAVVARWAEPQDIAVLGIYIGALIVLLATDLDQKLLPDLITLPLVAYAAAVTFLGLNPVLDGKAQVVADGDITAVAAAFLAPALLLISDRIFKGALGMGDVKLAISLGLMFGLSALFVGFLVSTIVFAAVVVVLVLSHRVTLKTAIPFGPALIGAGIIASVL